MSYAYSRSLSEITKDLVSLNNVVKRYVRNRLFTGYTVKRIITLETWDFSYRDRNVT